MVLILCIGGIGFSSIEGIRDIDRRKKSKSGAVRMGLLRELMRTRSKAGLRELKDFLDDGEAMIRRKAIEGVGGFGYEEGVNWVIKRLRVEKNDRVKKAGIISLGKLKDERARWILKSYLNDKNFIIRIYAKKSLKILDQQK